VTGLLASFATWTGGGLSYTSFTDSESYPWLSVSWLHVNYTVGNRRDQPRPRPPDRLPPARDVVYSWDESREPGAWFGLVLLTCLGCVGVFVALDILLFFLFLGGRPHPDVLHDRLLGRAAPPVRGDQILRLHPRRERRDAGLAASRSRSIPTRRRSISRTCSSRRKG